MSAPVDVPVREDAARWPWIVAVALAMVGIVVNVVRPTAAPLPSGVPDVARFDPAVLAAIDAYRAPRVALLPVLLLVPLLVAWWCARPGRRRIGRLAGAEPAGELQAAWFAGRTAVVIVVLAGLAVLPVRAWLGLVHESRWGFRTSTVAAWWTDATLVSVGRWLTVGVAVAILVLMARRWPRTWPARATIGVALAAYGVVLLHPVVLQPLLLSTEPLPPGDLRDDLGDVVAAAGLDVPLVVGDASRRTTRFNAVVVGLGPTERVVLFDTLLELPTDQIVALVGHELAHQQHRDLLRGTALAPTVVLPLALGWSALARRRRPGDPRAAGSPRLVPLLVATGLTLELLSTPVVAGLSRRVEAAADEASFTLGADPATAVALLRSGVVRDLAAPDPPAWLRWGLATHPSPAERIRAAVAAAERAGDDVPDRATYEADEAERQHPRFGTSSAAGEATCASCG